MQPALARLALGLVLLALLSACVAPPGTRNATQRPTQPEALTAAPASRATDPTAQPAETISASMPADFTPQPTSVDESVPPT